MEFIRRLRLCGWNGPEPGGKHGVMRHPSGYKIPVPNPHRGDLDWSLVKRILAQAEIPSEQWEKAGRQ
jgi:predicted RNA binding protein YcfA (HicA-like mRNA interferase family)